MSETVHSFCRICESLCGLEISLDRGRVLEVRPDRAHVASRGFACVKGLKQMALYDSPDRLQRPLKRVGGAFREIPWRQAFDEIGAKVRELRGLSPHALARGRDEPRLPPPAGRGPPRSLERRRRRRAL